MSRATRRLAAVVGTALTALAASDALRVRRAAAVGDPGGRDHGALVGAGLGEPLHVVLLGDSAVDGYGLDTASSMPRQLASRLSVATGRRVAVRSLAVSGATSSDVAAFQVPLLRAAGDVDVVYVGVGVNDVLQRVGRAAIVEATRQYVTGIRTAAPDALLVVATCPDLSRAPGFGRLLGRVVGTRGRRVAAVQRSVLEDHGVPEVASQRRPDPSMFGPDGLHPGPLANEALASLATQALVAESA